ncbi:hypothetical protein DFH28DRAFT_1088139 [Melampsora americana]|nr:hypothetical protein DFH28DRAFT_1088139 [Melampsora americana]
MTLPGQNIRPKRKRKPGIRKPKTQTGQQLAELQGRENDASNAIIKNLLPVRTPNQDPDDDELPSDFPDLNQQDAYRQTDHTNSGINPFSDDDESEYDGDGNSFKGETYQERCLREEKQWQKVFPEMFNQFIQVSRKTSQWGNPNLWDVDWKEPCQCPPNPPRKLVVFDILFRKEITVDFCSCQSEASRLVSMGLIGGTAKQPRTAFSIRLIRLYHLLWKFCSIGLAPFCQALDEFLDAFNAMVLVAKANKPREWRKPFTSAVDAYREMIRREGELSIVVLKLTALEQLASNCPRCFGPEVPGKRPSEPDVIVSLDGNFQHRRHKAASAEWRSETTVTPSLFLPPDFIEEWDSRIGICQNGTQGNQVDQRDEELLDPCTERHTAADDVRGHHTWNGCDETGIFGMACRHDHILKFINIVQSGERGHFPVATIDWMLTQLEEADGDPKKLGVLYDIGCNLTKSIKKERSEDRLIIGTGAWHSYAHERSCQILYNPRLNDDWGMSDGEGLERIWSAFTDLVASLRYSTKFHRICSLNLRGIYHNESLREKAVDSMLRRLKEMEKLYRSSKAKLEELYLVNPRYTTEYLVAQWKRQRKCQLDIIVTEGSKELTKKIAHLVDLEEHLHDAQKRRRSRTRVDDQQLQQLPAIIAMFNEEVSQLANDLGGDQFRNVPAASTMGY